MLLMKIILNLLVLILGFVMLFILISIMALSFINAEVIINEISIKDPEYIEFYNPTNEAINLNNYNISDANSIDAITCYNIPNCNLTTNSSYFLIIDRSLNIASITSENITYFYVDDNSIGNGLNDAGDNLTFFNSTWAISYNYTTSTANKTFQHCLGNWTENPPTPGMANNCTVSSLTNNNCTLSYTCGGWGSCSNKLETRTCVNTSATCVNTTRIENKTCSNADDVSIDFSWTKSEIVNNQAFNITLEANNLEDMDYDVKVWLESNEEDLDLKSEIYDPDSKEWKSSNYFLASFFSGDGDQDSDVQIRVKSGYTNFTGDAIIYFKLRETDSGDTIDSINDSIKILQGEDSSSDNGVSNNANTNSVSSNSLINSLTITNRTKQTEGIKMPENSMYLSRTEQIKKYAPYAFSVLCIFLLSLIVIDLTKSKKQNGNI